MPVHPVVKNGKHVGWQWGGHGKVYATKEQAMQQARAAYANGYKGKDKPKKKGGK